MEPRTQQSSYVYVILEKQEKLVLSICNIDEFHAVTSVGSFGYW